jgi:predicted nucleic acid-binding protein
MGGLALLHSKDVNHARAAEVWRDIGSRDYDAIVTDWVIAETGNGLARTRIRHIFADAAERIWASPKVEVVMIDRDLMAKAIDYYRRHSDMRRS